MTSALLIIINTSYLRNRELSSERGYLTNRRFDTCCMWNDAIVYLTIAYELVLTTTSFRMCYVLLLRYTSTNAQISIILTNGEPILNAISTATSNFFVKEKEIMGTRDAERGSNLWYLTLSSSQRHYCRTTVFYRFPVGSLLFPPSLFLGITLLDVYTLNEKRKLLRVIFFL